MKYEQLDLFTPILKTTYIIYSRSDDKKWFIQKEINSIVWIKDENGITDLFHKKYINILFYVL